MSTVNLTEVDREILTKLGEEDGAFQHNTWALPGNRRDLDRLKRRGLIDASGREPYR